MIIYQEERNEVAQLPRSLINLLNEVVKELTHFSNYKPLSIYYSISYVQKLIDIIMIIHGQASFHGVIQNVFHNFSLRKPILSVQQESCYLNGRLTLTSLMGLMCVLAMSILNLQFKISVALQIETGTSSLPLGRST